MKDNKLGLGKKIRMLKQTLLVLPRVLATEGVNFSKKAFVKQGWTDQAFQKWDKRKQKTKGKQRAILVKSGDLRRSVRVLSLGMGRATYGSTLKYAPVHNAGLHAGRGRGFQMPKRQFVGQSAKLNRIYNLRIALAHRKILNSGF